MKIARFLYKKDIRWGQVHDGFIPTPHLSRHAKARRRGKTTDLPVDEYGKNASSGFHNMGKPVAVGIAPKAKYKGNTGLPEGRFIIPLRGQPYGKISLNAQQHIPLKNTKLLPPATPTKVVLVGLNYKDHVRELNLPSPGEPIIFLKPNTSIIGHQQAIAYPNQVKRLDYEAELAVVIGKEAKSILKKDALKYILGYTCLNDVTARDLQKKDVQWTRSKSFDTFCPLGPWLETELDPSNLKIESYLNGKLKQSSSTGDFIFSVSHLVWFVSGIMTLFPGDVISTGTPAGIGRMRKGDIVEVRIEGIGSLKNRVA